jgi:hypothetical protein
MPFELSTILDDCKAANLRNLEVAGRTVVHLDVSHAFAFSKGFDRIDGPVGGLVSPSARTAWNSMVQIMFSGRSGATTGCSTSPPARRTSCGPTSISSACGPKRCRSFCARCGGFCRRTACSCWRASIARSPAMRGRPARAVELTWAEAVAVLLAAGFDIIMPKGLLLGLDREGPAFGVERRSPPRPSWRSSRAASPESRFLSGVPGGGSSCRDSGRPADLARIAELLRYAGGATARKDSRDGRRSRASTRRRAARRGVLGRCPQGVPPTGRPDACMYALRAGRYRATLQVQRTGKAVPCRDRSARSRRWPGGGAVDGRVEIDLSRDLPTEAWTPVEIEVRLDRSCRRLPSSSFEHRCRRSVANRAESSSSRHCSGRLSRATPSNDIPAPAV